MTLPVLLFASWIAAGQEPSAVDAAPAAATEALEATEATVRLVWTGGSGGIGGGRYTFDMLGTLGDRASEIRAYHGALAQGAHLVLADDRTLASLVSMLRTGGVTCGDPEAAVERVTIDERLVTRAVDAEWLAELPAETVPVVVRTCRAGDRAATLVSPASAPEPSWRLGEFEVRLAFRAAVSGDAVDIVGIPAQEPARRFTRLASVAKGALFVDAGSFVDGPSSVRDGALSLHRPLGFSMLQRLGAAALTPGWTELAGGARPFLDQARAAALPYVASNWRADDPALQLVDHVIRDVETPGGALTIAFFGVVDPAVRERVPALVDEGVELLEPVAAVQAVVDRVVAARHPDLTVLLTTARPELVADLARQLEGLDLVIGTTVAPVSRVDRLVAELGPRSRGPWVLPIDGIASAELVVRDGGLVRVDLQTHGIPESLDPDPAVLAGVTATRAAEYPPLEGELLRPAGDARSLVNGDWERVVCESVAEFARADVVLLPELPTGRVLPGPLTELLLADRLAVLDQLELHRIPGDRMPDLLNRLYGLVPVSCGAPLGSKAPKARGRAIEPDRMYRVVTTDRARLATPVGPLLQGSYLIRALDDPFKPLLTEDGTPVTLRTAVLRTLRELRGDGDTDVAAELIARTATDKDPQMVLRVGRLALGLVGFQGAGDAAYEAIPETLATSPSSFTVSGDLDVALEYSSSPLLADLRLRSTYARLTASGAAQETADDLRLSSSAGLPGVSIPAGPLSFLPYGELLFDSELTPGEAEDGSKLPRQADLYVTAGLTSRPEKVLRKVRLGAFGLRDLSVLDKRLEFGGRVEGETRVSFGPGLRWTSTLDGSVYAPNATQDESDLRFKALFDTRLSLPLARYLGIEIYGQGFVFQGAVEATSRVGSSWTAGFALDVVGAFQL